MTERLHPSQITSQDVVVYKQVASEGPEGKTVACACSISTIPFSQPISSDAIESLPCKIPVTKVALEPNPKLGVGSIGWSRDSRFFFSRNGTHYSLITYLFCPTSLSLAPSLFPSLSLSLKQTTWLMRYGYGKPAGCHPLPFCCRRLQ